MKKDQPIECVGCNTFDVGTVIDNSQCTASFKKEYTNEDEAKQALAYLTRKAKNVETDPCQIHSEMIKTETGYLLKANFEFCCQAEALIFELAIR